MLLLFMIHQYTRQAIPVLKINKKFTGVQQIIFGEQSEVLSKDRRVLSLRSSDHREQASYITVYWQCELTVEKGSLITLFIINK